MIQYKIDVIELLKTNGYSTYKLRQEKILSESVVQALRSGRLVGLDIIDKLCDLCHCRPDDLLAYHPNNTEE